MAFSRRVGELWEPFCRLAVDHPLSDITLFIPPTFADIKAALTKEVDDYIRALTISKEQRAELLRYYAKVWALVTSGAIKMALDLHFSKGDEYINIDFKSGFGSNEKGNTNRLLLVGTIYKNLPQKYSCVLLVRSREDQNNHYFQTLKNSGVWDAHCGEAAYEKLASFTGFPLKEWIREHMNWEDDLTPSTTKHLRDTGLNGYLSW